MIEVELDPATRHIDPHYERKLREAKRACKEAARWQCEHVYPNGQRCSARQGQLHRRKGRHGEPDGWSVMRLHACHVGNKQVRMQQFICFCPKHHAEYDRGIESQEQQQARCYRKGYQLTSTDALLEELKYAGITIWEQPDGYYWHIDGTTLQGHRTTAVKAVSAALAQLKTCLATVEQELAAARDEREQGKRTDMGPLVEVAKRACGTPAEAGIQELAFPYHLSLKREN